MSTRTFSVTDTLGSASKGTCNSVLLIWTFCLIISHTKTAVPVKTRRTEWMWHEINSHKIWKWCKFIVSANPAYTSLKEYELIKMEKSKSTEMVHLFVSLCWKVFKPNLVILINACIFSLANGCKTCQTAGWKVRRHFKKWEENVAER